jgi:hypothetical protein
MRPRFLLGIVFMAFAAGPASAEPTFQLDANDTSYSYVCGGGDSLSIHGNGNSITIRGECSVLDLSGSGNKITAESIASIKVNGNNNDVRYASAPNGKPRPAIKNKGAANSIRRAS